MRPWGVKAGPGRGGGGKILAPMIRDREKMFKGIYLLNGER